MKETSLRIKEFEQELDGIESLCEAWLRCDATTGVAKDALENFVSQGIRIDGYSGMPDDFDWDSIDRRYRKRCDRAIEKHASIIRLVAAVRLAFAKVEETEDSLDSGVIRSHYFGKFTAEMRWSPP